MKNSDKYFYLFIYFVFLTRKKYMYVMMGKIRYKIRIIYLNDVIKYRIRYINFGIRHCFCYLTTRAYITIRKDVYKIFPISTILQQPSFDKF